jgi:hypothetical protein
MYMSMSLIEDQRTGQVRLWILVRHALTHHVDLLVAEVCNVRVALRLDVLEHR